MPWHIWITSVLSASLSPILLSPPHPREMLPALCAFLSPSLPGPAAAHCWMPALPWHNQRILVIGAFLPPAPSRLFWHSGAAFRPPIPSRSHHGVLLSASAQHPDPTRGAQQGPRSLPGARQRPPPDSLQGAPDPAPQALAPLSAFLPVSESCQGSSGRAAAAAPTGPESQSGLFPHLGQGCLGPARARYSQRRLAPGIPPPRGARPDPLCQAPGCSASPGGSHPSSASAGLGLRQGAGSGSSPRSPPLAVFPAPPSPELQRLPARLRDEPAPPRTAHCSQIPVAPPASLQGSAAAAASRPAGNPLGPAPAHPAHPTSAAPAWGWG